MELNSHALAQVDAEREQTNNNEDTESFVRIEDKFVISKSHLPALLNLLNSNLEPCYFGEKTEFNEIESLYFDSATLKVYQDHFQEGLNRFKLRLRTYAPNGVYPSESEPVHLEMKQKADGVCRKFRFKVGPSEKQELLQGKPIPPAYALRKKKATLRERLLQVNSTIGFHKLRPQARVTYQRLAFERDGFRVTVDDKIKTEVIATIDAALREKVVNSPEFQKAKEMIARYQNGDVVIVEVKHSGTIPAWIQSFFDNQQIATTSFSKYAFTISRHLLENK